jgi:hypothetical protein
MGSPSVGLVLENTDHTLKFTSVRLRRLHVPYMYVGIKPHTFTWDVPVTLHARDVLSWTFFVLEVGTSVPFRKLRASADIKNYKLKSKKIPILLVILSWAFTYNHVYFAGIQYNVYSCILLWCCGVLVSPRCCWCTIFIIFKQAVQNSSCVGCGAESPDHQISETLLILQHGNEKCACLLLCFA